MLSISNRIFNLRVSQRCLVALTKRNNSQNAIHNDDESIKENILNASLRHVPLLGWTNDAIVAGAADLGHPSITHGVFPRGPVELALHHYEKSNTTLVHHMQVTPCTNKKTFISDAIEKRLSMQLLYVEHLPQYMALLSMPWNASSSLQLLQQLVNEIWLATGDKTVDMNWYSKRIMLAGVYKSSELYMASTLSTDHVDVDLGKEENVKAAMQQTRRFVDRRIEDVMSFGKLTAKFQNKDEINNLLTGAVQVGKNILSINDRKR